MSLEWRWMDNERPVRYSFPPAYLDAVEKLEAWRGTGPTTTAPPNPPPSSTPNEGVSTPTVPADKIDPAHVLDPSDPFDAVLVDILATNRRKRRDYVTDGESPFENFVRSADQVGVEPGLVVEVLIATKQARLRALSRNGRSPRNETVEDSLLDRAVYSIIALANHRQLNG